MQLGNRLRGLVIVAAVLAFGLPTSLLGQEKPQRITSEVQAAGEGDPVAVVSIANLNKIFADIRYMAEVAGQEQAAQTIEFLASSYTTGIDRTRPWGVAVQMIDGAPSPLIFLPSKDIKRFLRILEAQIGPPDDLGNGKLAIALGANIFFIQQVGDWAFAAPDEAMLENLPADPSAWLAGMGDVYNVGLRANVQALSPEQRELVISQLREGFETGMAQQPAESAEQIREVAERSLDQLESLINESNVIQAGFAIEPANKRLKFEFAATAVTGSELAEIYDGSKVIPSKFASVISPEAVAFFHAASSISPKGIEQSKASLKEAVASTRGTLELAENLSETDRKELLVFLDRLIEIGAATLDEGKSDVGGMIRIDDEQLNAVAGFFVSDGSKVAQLAKDLAAKLRESGQAEQLKFLFDADNYKGVVLHYVETDVPESETQVRQIFGPTIRLIIGTGPDAVYLAAGKEGESFLKGLIDSASGDQGGERPLVQAELRLLPILEFAQGLYANDAVESMIEILSSNDQSDRVQFVTETVPRGSVTALTIGEGILRAVGSAVAAQAGMAQQGDQF